MRWLARSGNAHGLHSPYFYDLYRQVRAASGLGHTPAYRALEAARGELLQDSTKITIGDFGAGSLVSASRMRQVRSIAVSGLMRPAWCRRLAVLVAHLKAMQPGHLHILELGTSLGLTTAYLATAAGPQGQVTTLEGCPETLARAQHVWQSLDFCNIQSIQGDIAQTLSQLLAKGQQFDLVILDANHRLEPVLAYFTAILPHLAPNAVIVVDDLYWTPEMTQAWQALRRHPAVCQSIDWYRQGWLFFRQAQAREHFDLRP